MNTAIRGRFALGPEERMSLRNVLCMAAMMFAAAAPVTATSLIFDNFDYPAGPLNGRGLADDVIDVELNLVTQGAIPGDGVGPHGDYLSSFPYLGLPH